MSWVTVVEGLIVSLWALLNRKEGSKEIVRKLEDESELLRATMDDVRRESLSNKIQRGRKRKRDKDLQQWVTECGVLLKEVDDSINVGEDRNFLMCAKMRKIAGSKFEALVDHGKKLGDIRDGSVETQCPRRGASIPVKELSQVASTYLDRLQDILLDDEVGGIAIHGMEGIGKTFLMKHLHNCAINLVNRFDYVFWVTLSHPFSVKHVQDAIAAAVMCDLPNTGNLSLKAKTLSSTLGRLQKCVLFIDDVPEARFSLEEVGIPVPTEGSKCKVVLTTRSTLVCRKLDCFRIVKLDPHPEIEACQLFRHEAGLGMGSASSINEIASLLAKECCGVPRMIERFADSLYGIDDIHEWRNALAELGNPGKQGKLSFQVALDELKRGRKLVKKDLVVHSSPSVE